jgi:membrane protein implicated in regulation of membrane protease activity
MADWIMWLIAAGALVILEMFSATFYLLMVAIGMVAGALTALAGGVMWLQLLAAAAMGIFATLALRRSRGGKAERRDAAHDPNINIDIGQQVVVGKWTEHAGSAPGARVMYRGAQWDVELAPGNLARPGTFTIVEVRGSRLILSSASSNALSGASSDNNSGR